MTTTANPVDVAALEHYNYFAFLQSIAEFGLTAKDVRNIYYTDKPLLNALEVYKEKIKDLNSIIEFLKLLKKELPNKPLAVAYNSWFVNNTNAASSHGGITNPEEVSWSNFVVYCKQKHNLTARDLSLISSDQQPEKRESIKSLFKKAATTNKKTTLKFIELFATMPPLDLSGCYNRYMGKHATDTSAMYLTKDVNYNYTAWLNAVTDPDGQVKLTKEEVMAYFKECKNNIQMSE
jgi:hypothetical protein